MDLEAIEKKLSELEDERTAIWEERAPLDARLQELHEEIQPLQTQRDQLRIASGGLEWPTLVKELPSNDSSVKMLRYAQSKLDKDFGMHLGGYYPDTMEQSIQLKVAQTDESEKKNLAGLKYFASILTPHKDGRLWFGIF